MVYSITIEDSSKISNVFEYLEKNGDFIIREDVIILHTKLTKPKVIKDFKSIFGKDFQIIVKQINEHTILSQPKVVLRWYASDNATLKKQQITNYKKEALSILNQVVDTILEQKGGGI